MNAILPQRMALPASRTRALLAVSKANAGEVADALEKYEHLQELAELFFAAKRHYLDVPGPRRG